MDVELQQAFSNMIDHVDSLKGDLLTIKTNVATKGDLDSLRSDLESLRADMVTKGDLDSLRTDLESLRADMVTKEDLEKAVERLRIA